jgi:uncharacterized protein
MSTERVAIGPAGRLEGILEKGAPNEGGVVICHPHPLYGGNMWNPVVGAMADGFAEVGLTTLRFNFRGVGRSTGVHGDGIGEIEDVREAYRFVQREIEGRGRFVLAGYSFGAWVCARTALAISEPVDLFLVSYPFSMYSSEPLENVSTPIYFVGGSFDDISPVESLVPLYERLTAEKHLKIVQTSHFFEGKEQEIKDFIMTEFRKEGK